MKVWYVLMTILILFLPGPGGEQLAANTNQQNEICYLIKSSVEDNSWWQARSFSEVKNKLSKYYSEPLLSKVTERTWNFIKRPTDWYCKTTVTSISVRYLTSQKAIASATLLNTDLVTGQLQKGTGYFSLHKTIAGWRIVAADYHWEEKIKDPRYPHRRKSSNHHGDNQITNMV
ncbi:hypothetical protein [Desulfofundulus sp.]|uniref:hypothetical protein n=1 Tax=Desulfofundulus sp. TaxID=2282750 RepID=UPI003C706A21